jgi:hypothetical protein
LKLMSSTRVGQGNVDSPTPMLADGRPHVAV